MGIDAVSLLIAGLAALISIVAARYSRQQAQVARGQLKLAEIVRKEQNEPYVVVDIQPADQATQALMLVIENIGTTVARDVRIRFDPPLKTAREITLGKPIRDAKILTHGIPLLPPKRRIELWFDNIADLVEKSLPMIYEAIVDVVGPDGQPIEQMRYTIDLEVLRGVGHVSEKSMHHAVQELEKLNKKMSLITNPSGRSNADRPLSAATDLVLDDAASDHHSGSDSDREGWPSQKRAHR